MEGVRLVSLFSLLRRNGLIAATLAVILIGVRLGGAGFRGGLSQIADGPRAMFSIVAQMFPPNFGYAGRIITDLSESLLMALLSTAIAVGTVVFCRAVSAKFSLSPSLRRAGHACLRGIGAAHALVWAVVLVRCLGAGPVSGFTALTLYSLGRFVVGSPTALLDQSLACLERNIRLSAVLGLVGAGGIGELLYANIQFQLWPNVGVILAGIIAMVLAVDGLCGLWRLQLTSGQAVTSQQARQRAS